MNKFIFSLIDLFFFVSTILGTPRYEEEELLEPRIEIEVFEPKPLNSFVQNLDENGYDLLQKMLKYNSKLRISAAEALQHPFFSDLLSENQPKLDKTNSS